MKVIDEEIQDGIACEVGEQICNVPAETAEPTELAPVQWLPFCSWLMQNFHGIETTIERCEEGARVTECHKASLVFLAPRILANGVRALTLGVEINGQRRNLNVTAPQAVCLRSNAAGYPTLLEIGYPAGKLVLHFDGDVVPAPGYTANSWGE